MPVFRLYEGGSQTYQGWDSNPAFPYNSTARATIKDPNGASAKNEITSIPSPFARIDLVKTAFGEVCNSGNLDGNTIFHKMVSDSLDVGEIFFNIDRFADKVEIITCDVRAAINQLKSDGNASHLYVADSLEKYLVSDAVTYNFAQMRNIYLLNYKQGPDQLNIIGATSPATLFFSNANDLGYVNDIFFANNDKPFDGNYAPLYQRDFEYVKAWWALRVTIPNFSQLFPEIDEYLALTFRAIADPGKKEELNGVTAANLGSYAPIDVQVLQQINQVEVLGYNLLKKQSNFRGNSEFQIKPTRNVSDMLPLVLPVEAGNKYAAIEYVNGQWGKTNKADYKVGKPDIAQRKLPFDGTKFPYLTISDFLEDTIVSVPHALNKRYYYDGGFTQCEKTYSFLLPLKPLFFKYFDTGMLATTMPDGKKLFEMTGLAGGSVNVTLRIPIVGNQAISYIEYQRCYYKDRVADVSAEANEGGMKSFDFTGLVMPSMRFSNDEDAYYTVACVSGFSSSYQLEFFKEDQVIQNIPMDCRHLTREVAEDYKAETYTLEHTNFDFIRIVGNGGVCGLMVPCFKEHRGGTNFEFAVDLGTSNTHIEYKKTGAQSSSPLDYEEKEALCSTFFVQSEMVIEGKRQVYGMEAERELIVKDFVPFMVGKGDFFFPTRTALSFAKTVDWTQNLRPFGLLNFYLTYDKRQNLTYNDKPKVNIKWSNEPNAQAAMQAYINSVMLLIRNKVVANNGNLSNVQVTWFYPNSMSPWRIAQLRMAWNNAYAKWFNPQGTTCGLSESIAPIRYYFGRYATATNLVNVDIGGGTTDIAFATNGNVDYITSFKFAANSLFEDSFSGMNPNNGIVDWFKDDIARLLQSRNELNELANIFRDNEGQPSNMASFLFSLKDNSATKSLAQSSIDFNKILQDDTKFKLVFVIFYTAIIYNIAQIVKEKQLKAPRHIAFSGNGSKVINILSPDKNILEAYTKKVFEQVMGCAYSSPLEILGLGGDSNPKEATSKGGLVGGVPTMEPTRLVLKDFCGHLVEAEDTYASVDDAEKHSIVNSVEEFFKFVLEDMPGEFKFDDNFGVDKTAFDIAKEVCSQDLNTYLQRGINISVNESGDINNTIEDALSFYPIKGVIQALSDRLKVHYSND